MTVNKVKAIFITYLLSFAILSAGIAQAQESFYSVSGAYRAEFTNLPWTLELQSGTVANNIMFRLGVELPLLILSGDVSYIYDIANSGTSVYAGVGADAGAFIIAILGLHALAGLEFKQDNVGVFAEYQLSGFVSGMPREENAPDLIFTKLKLGLNIYY